MRNLPTHPTTAEHAFAFMHILLIGVGTTLFSLFIALTTKPVADFLYDHVARIDDPALNALEFAVYPLLIAFGIALWRPRLYGLHIGLTFSCWRTVIVSLLVVGLVVGGYVLPGNRTPWDSKGLVNFTVVPVYEELLFRGILFTLILAYARHHYTETHSVWIAIIVSALGFGIGHLTNGFYVGWSFAVFQMLYATLFGLLAGYNRARTESVIAPVLLHALMNAIPIIL
jgi:membrane protease YdiL (CAAX protease family)